MRLLCLVYRGAIYLLRLAFVVTVGASLARVWDPPLRHPPP